MENAGKLEALYKQIKGLAEGPCSLQDSEYACAERRRKKTIIMPSLEVLKGKRHICQLYVEKAEARAIEFSYDSARKLSSPSCVHILNVSRRFCSSSTSPIRRGSL